MILRILDWLYCWTATFCLCMVRGIAPTRPSCHWMCGQTIVSILVRLVFWLEKCWVKDVCFFGTKPWVFQKNMTGNHEFPAWWSSYVLFVLLGSRLLFQGYPNTWILFTNISIYVHCFFRQVLTICNLSCFNSHFFFYFSSISTVSPPWKHVGWGPKFLRWISVLTSKITQQRETFRTWIFSY